MSLSNQWTRSSMCESNACVEASREYGDVLIRNSKNREFLVFSKEEWGAFIAAAKAGEFDL